jgi:predicted DNA-binding protein with PD1-like motif
MHPDRRIAQPGPALEPRVIAAPTSVRAVEFVLAAGTMLLDGLYGALGPCPGAVIHLEDGAFGPFTYVIPSLSETPEHAAFYSNSFTPGGASRIDCMRITYGTRDNLPWLHCHGIWTEADGTQHAGHVIPDHTWIAEAVTCRAWVLEGAAFTARHDPETNFTLFAPEAIGPAGPCFALRLRPNQDLCGTLEQFCANHGIASATIRGGVASIIGAVFEDGREALAFATEIFIADGTIDADGARLDIGLVNYRGEIWEGRLKRGANPVLMTAELLIIPSEPSSAIILI